MSNKSKSTSSKTIPVRLDEGIVNKVKKHIKTTKQTLGGFFYYAAEIVLKDELGKK